MAMAYLSEPPSPAPSDNSISEGDGLSFEYYTDDRGQFIRRTKTPTATGTYNINTAVTTPSPTTSTSNSPGLGGGSTMKPGGLTRGRSESAVVMPGSGSSVGSTRPFSRVASATVVSTSSSTANGGRFAYGDATTTSSSSSVREKENRHPRTASLRPSRQSHLTTSAPAVDYRTPASVRTTSTLATSTRIKYEDRAATPDDPPPPYVRPTSGLGMNVSRRLPGRDDPAPNPYSSSLIRTPSVTATLPRRGAGPMRVTMAEKMKQEEEVRREDGTATQT
ncbi:hypothetical protein EXIGLDRAFT_475355 [Exidia glandulosa HHB12029]|uniref:Uncharacterized protein n=1 Tax=Exidia glandulosa HHB12029 TaxID=1314781 RepID=A0A165Z4K1_EXIGL|nr:hypothetical protein EXIGLDRAFT_475355 [Exidia glandulosa HHB12029]